jgi:putative transposase
VANGIFYLLRTGCQWKALPPQFGAPSTVHRYFQEWARRRVFHRFWKKCLQIYDARRGIGWRWQALDGATTKAPLGGEKTGKNPTDRGKLGVKRSVVTDSRGVPLGIALAGANTHDAKLLRATLKSIPIPRPKSAGRCKQHLCLDKGCTYRARAKCCRYAALGNEPAAGSSRVATPGQTVPGGSLCAGKRKSIITWPSSICNLPISL